MMFTSCLKVVMVCSWLLIDPCCSQSEVTYQALRGSIATSKSNYENNGRLLKPKNMKMSKTTKTAKVSKAKKSSSKKEKDTTSQVLTPPPQSNEVDSPAPTTPEPTAPKSTTPPEEPIAQQTIVIDPWQVPSPSQPYLDQDAKSGDTIQFNWENTHNVYIHPTGDCDITDRIFVGQTSPAQYQFTDVDVGKTLTFVCDIGSHCDFGMIFNVSVTAA